MDSSLKDTTLNERVIMVKREKHWEKMEAYRTINGKLPDHAFDFISIHFNERENAYSLISPLCICENIGMNRPQFENDRYPTLRQVERAASMNAALHSAEVGKRIFVVDCRD